MCLGKGKSCSKSRSLGKVRQSWFGVYIALWKDRGIYSYSTRPPVCLLLFRLVSPLSNMCQTTQNFVLEETQSRFSLSKDNRGKPGVTRATGCHSLNPDHR